MRRHTSWDLIGIISALFMIGLVLFSIYSVGARIDYIYRFHYIINLTFDLVGMSVCTVLFLSTVFDRRISSVNIYFMAMVMLECLLLFWNTQIMLLNGNSQMGGLLDVVTYYYYVFLMLIMISFWLYIKHVIKAPKDEIRHLNIAYCLTLAAGLLILVSNVFTGALFTVHERTGIFQHGDYFPLAFAAPLMLIFLTTYVAHKYTDSKRQKAALYFYVMLPLGAAILQLVFPSLKLIPLSILFSIFLLYGNFYMDKGQELARMESRIAEQKVTMMISQIQPYILYSSIKSIERIPGNPPSTQKALNDFSKYLRSNLNTLTQKNAIPFEKEMEHVETYIELEKLRFKNKLKIEYDIRDTQFVIPPLTLQMLVENAIKHGVTIKETGGTVTISTVETEDYHILKVADDGVGFDTSKPPADESRSHIGIINIKQRLSEMLDGSLDIESRIGEGTVATVTIPRYNDINPEV